jgi:hypothetical protein
LPGVSLRPGSLAFNPRPRRLSTPTDAFQLHPDVRSYGTTLTRRPGTPSPRSETSTGSRRASAAPRACSRISSRGCGRTISRPRLRGARGTSATCARLATVRSTRRFLARPRPRGARRSLRTLPAASLRPPPGFNP